MNERNGRRQPEIHRGDIGYMVGLPDDRILSLYSELRPDGRERVELENPAVPVYIRESTNSGAGWGEPRLAFSYEPGKGVAGNPYPLVTPDGVLHVLAVRFQKLGGDRAEESKSHSVVIHYSSPDGGGTWRGPHPVPFGKTYTGALNSAIPLHSGRIVLALSCPSDRYQGRNVCVSTVSDDGGRTWRPGDQELIVPDGEQPGHPGALEPVLLELLDGRIWMIIRTQTGFFYETHSSDGGTSWAEPVRTGFQAPNAPGALCRLVAGDVLFCWNDLSRYPADATGSKRQYLHIALSKDDGRTFTPSREVARRREGEAENTNVAYPYLTPTADGEVLLLYHRVGSVPDATWWAPIIEVLKIDPGGLSR